MASESSSNDTVAVSLRHREPTAATKPPVWPLDSSGALTPPLPAKCDRNDRSDGVCCKDLKDDDDRTLIDPDIVRDV
jgi:vacuolar iron transporter family protein